MKMISKRIRSSDRKCCACEGKFIEEDAYPSTDPQLLAKDTRHSTLFSNWLWSFICKVHSKASCKPCKDCSLRVSRIVFSFHIIVVLLMTYVPSAVAEETCSKRIVMHTIRFRNCIPKRQLTTACLGQCRSYAGLSPEDTRAIQRLCTCCQEVNSRVTRVPLRCPKPNGRRGYIRMVIPVLLPTSCMCRPCAQLPPIQAAEFMS